MLKLEIFVFSSEQELIEEDIDWWSKFYASVGDYDKCGDYIERGYDKIIVRFVYLFFSIQLSLQEVARPDCILTLYLNLEPN